MTAQYIQCRYLKHSDDQCTAEVADPDPKAIQLCVGHLVKAAELVRDRLAEARRQRTPTPVARGRG